MSQYGVPPLAAEVSALLARAPAHFIDGVRIGGGAGTISVRDPATGRIIAEALAGGAAEIETAPNAPLRAPAA